MNNLGIYDAVRTVSPNALKEIAAGRLKGKSDINPMWRIKMLTEQFGPCGIGWKYVITKQWLETGGKDEKAAFVNIDLFVKYEGEWSDAIPGTGGSSFVANEKNGPYVSDECFKMALTDAISVSCKALGFAADVYWNSDKTKYNQPTQNKQADSAQVKNINTINPAQQKLIFAKAAEKGLTPEDVKNQMLTIFKGVIKSTGELSPAQMDELIKSFAEKKDDSHDDWATLGREVVTNE